ncbi:BRCA1-associated RING domain protein 1-like [Argonauta hians]
MIEAMSESEEMTSVKDGLTITQLALRDLQEELKCSVCLKINSNLCSLGICEHLVCRSCINKGCTRTCPSCNLPFDAKDVKDLQLVCNLVDLSNQLRKVVFNLSPMSDDDEDEDPASTKLLSANESSESSAFSLFALEQGRLSPEAIIDQSADYLPHKRPRYSEKISLLSKVTKTSNKCEKRFSLPTYKSKSNNSDSLNTPRFSRFSNKARKRSAPALMNLASPESKQKSSSVTKTRSPAIMKKNAKGETPLHVAVIKNNLSKVCSQISEGANVNTKDHAGWTPLHEACHHGYEKVAKMLLDNGALINTPGSENDTALHDAVRNGRIGCVKLLVSHGASQTLRNARGLTAKDYAITDAMKEALETDVVVISPTPDLTTTSFVDGGPVCILPTALSRDLKVELRKLVSTINAKIVDDVYPEVTHVVIGVNKEGLCPRTLKYLKAILSGKWIVTLDWLRTCVEYGHQVSEEPFEIAGSSTNPFSFAPFKGRMNKLKQLPRLFDGCQFYFHGAFNPPVPKKEELMNLVQQGGGQVLCREPKLHIVSELPSSVPYHAVNCDNATTTTSQCGLFIVYAEETSDLVFHQHPRLCTVSVSSFMECIATFYLAKLHGIVPQPREKNIT